MLNPCQLRLAMRLKRLGIVNPIWTIEAAEKAHIAITLACALLEQESGGGHNEFGHDPTIFVGAGTVTEAKYESYLKQRGPEGRGGMQGVGPCQLTYFSYQDQADKLGGCWKPLFNMIVGFGLLHQHIMQYGLHAGVAAYNGSGPAAQAYADSVLRFEQEWARKLNLRSIQG